jgi:UDP-N-acetylglucosamine 2-epimerase (non-hydrolysing)
MRAERRRRSRRRGGAGPRLVAYDGTRDSEPDERPVLALVVAGRADAVTLAPVFSAAAATGCFRAVILNIGGPSSRAGVDELLADLGLPQPELELEAALGSDVVETAHALAAAERTLTSLHPAAVVISRASNWALGFGMAATKLGFPVARVEAGLRERDWSVPEEVNRVLLDTMSDTLFATTAQSAANLRAEGAGLGRVELVGSTAIDTLRRVLPDARRREVWRRYGLSCGTYVLVTMHHTANVSDDERLARIVEALAELATRVPVVFPMHPRTRAQLEPMGDAHRLLAAGVICGPPLRYADFLSLQAGAGAVVTDSSTVQEEATALGVACFTLRGSTERVETLTHGTNVLLSADPRDIADVRPAALGATPLIPYWDGRAGARIAETLVANYALVRA